MVNNIKLILLTFIFIIASSNTHCMQKFEILEKGKTYRELQAKNDLDFYIQDNIALVQGIKVHIKGKGEGNKSIPFTLKKDTKIILPNEIILEQCFGRNTIKAFRKTFKANEKQPEQLQWVIYMRNNNKKIFCFEKKLLMAPATFIIFSLFCYLLFTSK